MAHANVRHIKAGTAERKCIATGDILPKEHMFRFVVGPDNVVLPDLSQKLPGRGMWVSADCAALEKVIEKSLFSRAAKSAVHVAPTIVTDLDKLQSKRVIDLLSLARKAGQAVSGYEKVKDLLLKESAKILLQAYDGSQRGKSKLSTPHYGHFIGWLSADELGAAFGRQTVIHCAVASGGLAKRVVHEAQILKGLRKDIGGVVRRKGKDS